MNKWIKSAGLTLLAAAFILGCSSSKMSLKDMGAKGLQMAYKPKVGSSAKYQMTMNQKMTQEMMENEQLFLVHFHKVLEERNKNKAAEGKDQPPNDDSTQPQK